MTGDELENARAHRAAPDIFNLNESGLILFPNDECLIKFIEELIANNHMHYCEVDNYIRLDKIDYWDMYEIFGDLPSIRQILKNLPAKMKFKNHHQNKISTDCHISTTYNLSDVFDRTTNNFLSVHQLAQQMYQIDQQYPISLISANGEIEINPCLNQYAALDGFTYCMSHEGTIGTVYLREDYVEAILTYDGCQFNYHIFGSNNYLSKLLQGRGVGSCIEHDAWFEIIRSVDDETMLLVPDEENDTAIVVN